MSCHDFRRQIADLTVHLTARPLDSGLAAWLNQEHGIGSETYRRLQQSCLDGVAEGWLCDREAGGIRYGRVFKPADDLQRFSVDVVEMENIVGPEHRHPNGEVDLVMPLQGDALFDQQPAGWVVYPPGSVHKPSVSQGKALVMYLLPEGSIEFTR